MNNDKFKQYGRMTICGCRVDISKEAAIVYSECPEQASICAKYLYAEGFVDNTDKIEFREPKK